MVSDKKTLKTPETALARRLAAKHAVDAGVLENLDPISKSLVLNYGSPWGAYVRRRGHAAPPPVLKPKKIKVKAFTPNHKTWISFLYHDTFMEFADRHRYIDGITRIWKLFLRQHPDMIIPSSGCSNTDAHNIYTQKEHVRRAIYRAGMIEHGYRGLDAKSVHLDRISKGFTQADYEKVHSGRFDPDEFDEPLPTPFVKPRKLIFA
ncbi:hypothetical protein V5O48_005834 [Marasmius crinis-equi]|uniref:Uncharacterized protein n=1 Tax=Marasmius crinis-equi TaxID=585013 RepID=A0ABR3FL93_9AGAR